MSEVILLPRNLAKLTGQCRMISSHLQEAHKGCKVRILAEGKTWDPGKVYSTAEWKGFGLSGNEYLPIQTTYQEWKQWQDQLPADDTNKGKKCQDCHMRDVTGKGCNKK